MNLLRFLLVVASAVLATTCGRYGFENDSDGGRSKDGHTPFVDADYQDAPGTVGIDAAAPGTGPASCANYSLGSNLGAVASGSTNGHPDTYKTCSGAGSPDVSYAWTAPSAGQYTIDLCNGPDQSLDTALTVFDGGCMGTRLACDDDGCGTWLSKTKVTLTSGQLVIIVVDGNADSGKYVLTITKG